MVPIKKLHLNSVDPEILSLVANPIETDDPQKSAWNIVDRFLKAKKGTLVYYRGISYSYIGGHPYRDTVDFLNNNENPRLKELKVANYIYGPDKTYSILILGESPSAQEEDKGLNFVGDFGEALYQALADCGFDRFDDCYAANLIRVYPRPAHKAPMRNLWLPFLLKELLVLRPSVIICLGTSALRVFTTKALNAVIEQPLRLTLDIKVGDDEADSFDTVVYAAPLSALRERSEFFRFRNAVASIVNAINHKDTIVPSGSVSGVLREVPVPPIKEIYDAQELKNLVDAIVQAAEEKLQLVTCDLEWSGRFPCYKGAFLRVIGLYWDGDGIAHAIVMSDPEGNPVQDPILVAHQLDRLFAHPNVQIIGHYFISDAAWLMAIGCSKVIEKFLIPPDTCTPEYGGIFDTLSAHHAYDETGEFNLKEAAKLLLGYEPWNKEVLNFVRNDSGFGAVPNHILLPYLARDLYVTREFRDYHIRFLNQDQNGRNCWRAYVLNVRSLAAYLEMMYHGVAVDVRYVKRLQESYQLVLKDLEEELRSISGWSDFNPKSYDHKVVLLFGPEFLVGGKGRKLPIRSARLKPFKTTSGDDWDPSFCGREKPSTDFESLEFLASQSEAARLLRDYSAISQLLKTFLGPNGLIKFVCNEEVPRIHPMYFPYLETRRASSSKPNMQNLPGPEKEAKYQQIAKSRYIGAIRRAFIPDDGHIFVSADYVAAELLMLGVVSQDEQLLEDYQCINLPDGDPKKLDIHSNVAVLAFRLDCPPTKEALKSLGLEHLRLAAKRIIFGLNYGRSAESIHRQLRSSGVDITLEEVNQIITTIYTRYPKVKEFQDKVRERIREGAENPTSNIRWLANCFGSCRRFCGGRSASIVSEQEREALNFTCQSGVADAIAIAMANFMSHPLKEVIGYKLVMQLHDALIFMVPMDKYDAFRPVIRECMVDKVVLHPLKDLEGTVIEDKSYHFEVSIKALDVFS